MSARRSARARALALAAAPLLVVMAVSPGCTKSKATPLSTGDAGSVAMAGMDMTAPPGVPGRSAVMIAPEVQQRIGVKTAKIVVGSREAKVRTVGIVAVNETKVAHATIKTEGWVEQLFVTYVGQKVKKGEPLLAIYSPDFMATELEYLVARDKTTGDSAAMGPVMDSLAVAVRRRLELLDVPSYELDELDRTGHPRKYVTLRSRVTGTVIEKKAFLGQHVASDQSLFVIADLSTVWIQAQIYERDVPSISVGDSATISVPSSPERKTVAKIAFIDPVVDEFTRTVRVRIELQNPTGYFRPGMYADVEVAHETGEVLLAPVTAIIRTGERDLAYRVEPGDRFVPVEVMIAPGQIGEYFHVARSRRPR